MLARLWNAARSSKSGQLGFLRTAAIELAKYGITVNAVMPGNIITEGLKSLGPEYHKTMAASIPLKRLGTVEDVGRAVPRLEGCWLYHSDNCRGQRAEQRPQVGKITPRSTAWCHSCLDSPAQRTVRRRRSRDS